MQNIITKVNGNKLHIEVDLTKNYGPSKSGKNLIIASTQGNQSVEGRPNVKFGLNVYTNAAAS